MSRSTRITLLAALVVGLVLPVSAQAVRLRFNYPPVYLDAAEVGLKLPEDVGCVGERFVVSDTGNRRFVVYRIGDSRATPERVVPAGEVTYPTRVELAADGTIWALDGDRNRIGRIGPGGEFLGWLDLGDGVLPRSFRLGPDGSVAVLDAASARVLVLDADGTTIRTVSAGPDVRFLSDLTIDGSGRIAAIDSVGRRVYAAGESDDTLIALGPVLTGEVDFVTSIASDDAGRLFLADQHGGGIVILGRDGVFRGRQATYGWKPGMLRYPSGVCVDEGGRLVVADRDNNRVQVFTIAE